MLLCAEKSIGPLMLMVLISLLGSALVLGAESSQSGVDPFKPMLDRVEVSCSTMVVTDFHGDQLFPEGRARLRTLNVPDCLQRLVARPLSYYLDPMLDAAVAEKDLPADLPVMEPKSRTQQAPATANVTKRAAPLVALCKSARPSTGAEESRACYFGAPAGSAKPAAKAAFAAVATSSLPSGEALCAPLSQTRASQEPREFTAFPRDRLNRLDWAQTVRDLTMEGFTCSDSGDQQASSCMKFVLEVVLPAQKTPETLGNNECPFNRDAVLLLRSMQVYKGDWHLSGPPVHACPEILTTGNCARKPQRGAASGICMIGEDWHAWASSLFLINDCLEEAEK
jgi:hypothetical protein